MFCSLNMLRFVLVSNAWFNFFEFACQILDTRYRNFVVKLIEQHETSFSISEFWLNLRKEGITLQTQQGSSLLWNFSISKVSFCLLISTKININVDIDWHFVCPLLDNVWINVFQIWYCTIEFRSPNMSKPANKIWNLAFFSGNVRHTSCCLWNFSVEIQSSILCK